MRKIRSGDTVQVIAGKNKGKIGKVLKVLEKTKQPNSGLWLVVEGVNVAKKHVKPNPQREQAGGIVPREMPIHYSNVQLYDTTAKSPSRVGFKQLEDGEWVRYFKKSGEVVNV